MLSNGWVNSIGWLVAYDWVALDSLWVVSTYAFLTTLSHTQRKCVNHTHVKVWLLAVGQAF
jgi:hypothetical protein